MKKTPTQPWDAADYLETEEDMVACLEAALDEGDARLIAAALGDIARAKGMTAVGADAGLGRENLYKALSPHGTPEFATVLNVMRALGLRCTHPRWLLGSGTLVQQLGRRRGSVAETS